MDSAILNSFISTSKCYSYSCRGCTELNQYCKKHEFMLYFKLKACELFSSEWVNKKYIIFQGLSLLGKICIYLLYINIKKCLEKMERR